MFVKQISVFLENKAGRLAQVTKILKENQINIRALSIADTTDFGILRLIVDNPDAAQAALKQENLIVRATDVIAICIPDHPGALSDALVELSGCGVSVEYMYAYIGKDESDAIVVLKVDNPDAATKGLANTNVKVLPAKVVYTI